MRRWADMPAAACLQAALPRCSWRPPRPHPLWSAPPRSLARAQGQGLPPAQHPVRPNAQEERAGGGPAGAGAAGRGRACVFVCVCGCLRCRHRAWCLHCAAGRGPGGTELLQAVVSPAGQHPWSSSAKLGHPPCNIPPPCLRCTHCWRFAPRCARRWLHSWTRRSPTRCGRSTASA